MIRVLKSCQVLCAFLLIIQSVAISQSAVPILKQHTNELAAPHMLGRGYVEGGGDSAAQYITKRFSEYGLKQFITASNYYQSYRFPINTFPEVVSLRINRKTLEPGKDFLVHAASSAANFNNKKLVQVDLSAMKDSVSWKHVCNAFQDDKVYLLRHIDTVMKYSQLGIRTIAKSFQNRSAFILPMKQKLTWLATVDTIPATLFFVQDSVLPLKLKRASAVVDTKFIPAFSTQNIVGFVPGTQYPDSFLVFTAHYDHLGVMGKNIIFPGANDNANGVSVMLYLANYYAANPSRYSIAFMAFSGEEAGLVGSGYYVNNPVFPLKQIRFLINLDMTGDATNGITVVNATGSKGEFELMQQLQQSGAYLPALVARAQARNSDHFPFSEKGVPAVYIYTNGVKPYYHDLKDKPEEVNFEQVDGLLNLIKEFIQKL